MITNLMRLKKYNLCDSDLKLLDSIIYNAPDLEYLKNQIRKYLKNGYPISVLCNNWDDILLLGKDSSSIQSCITRYGKELGTEIFKTKVKSSTLTKDYYIQIYGEKKAVEVLSGRGASQENYIKRHGEVTGKQKWDEYCKKRKNTYNRRKKEGLYSHMSHNLEWFQERHGKNIGYKIWNDKRVAQAYKVSTQYYIDIYGEEEGKRKCKEVKTRSLENFIKKYGLIDGELRYKKWLNNIVSGLKNRRNYSVWSIECIEKAKMIIPDLFYYGENEMIWHLPKEYQMILQQKIISPDLFYRGKIIEFHGDVFHGNPSLFENNDTPHPFNKTITANELHMIDKNRKIYYESKGYIVLEIWENDYNSNRIEVVNKCLTFLK